MLQWDLISKKFKINKKMENKLALLTKSDSPWLIKLQPVPCFYDFNVLSDSFISKKKLCDYERSVRRVNYNYSPVKYFWACLKPYTNTIWCLEGILVNTVLQTQCFFFQSILFRYSHLKFPFPSSSFTSKETLKVNTSLSGVGMIESLTSDTCLEERLNAVQKLYKILLT